ncbi:hypothetical protein ACIBBD_13985 [Streptomyces sp. NPDC051315]|uniref:hypothetical protein n=1 Tax=Streptomyces sp. NPDC051315 TaxID=3365650 RepID=UPI0037AAEAE7
MRSLTRISWCGAIAALALSAGCSDEQSLSDKYPTQWQTCNTLFGTENMASLRDMVGPDDLELTNGSLSVDELKESLTEEALEPYNKFKGFDEYDVCRLSGDHSFSAIVAWAPASLKEVQSPSGRWHQVGTSVYVSDYSPIVLVFRCDIPGASSGQQAQVLLESRIHEVGAPEFTEVFHQKLTVSLARTLSTELACVNKPVIPDDLQIGE